MGYLELVTLVIHCLLEIHSNHNGKFGSVHIAMSHVGGIDIAPVRLTTVLFFQCPRQHRLEKTAYIKNIINPTTDAMEA